MAFKIGNTVRFTASFHNFAGALADSTTDVVIRIYNARDLVQFGSDITSATSNPSTGVYTYDYTIPSNVPASAIMEFSGTVDSVTIVGRTKFSSRFV